MSGGDGSCSFPSISQHRVGEEQLIPQKYHRTPLPIGILGTGCIWSSHSRSWGGIGGTESLGWLLPPNTLQWGEAENVCSSSPSPPPAPMQLPADCIMNQALIDTCSQPGEAGWAGGPPRCLQGLGGGCGGLRPGTFTDLPGIGWPQPALWGGPSASVSPCVGPAMFSGLRSC